MIFQLKSGIATFSKMRLIDLNSISDIDHVHALMVLLAMENLL